MDNANEEVAVQKECRSISLQTNAETRDRTGDLQIFGLTLSQLSYRGYAPNLKPSPELKFLSTCCQREVT